MRCASLKDTRAEIVLRLDSKKRAEAIYQALKPETHCSTGERSKVRMKLTKRDLQITVCAKDLNALRAALNSYLRWVSGCGDLANVIDESNA